MMNAILESVFQGRNSAKIPRKKHPQISRIYRISGLKGLNSRKACLITFFMLTKQIDDREMINDAKFRVFHLNDDLMRILVTDWIDEKVRLNVFLHLLFSPSSPVDKP